MAASSSKFPRKEILSPKPQPQPQPQPTTKPNDAIDKPQQRPSSTPSSATDILSPSQEDLALSMSSHLTRQELLRRRLHRLRQLSKVYRDHYWALMEDLRFQYREYYWKYGVSPYKEEEERESGGGGEREFGGFNVEGCGETNHNGNGSCVVGGNGNGGGGGGGGSGGKLGLGVSESVAELKVSGNNRCTFVGCKLKAMALTNFCHLHILSDPQQKLYKACNYVIKSAQAGPILCGKPILRSSVPSLCNIHFQKAQKHVTRALKKGGVSVSSSSKLAPNIHVIVAEYVREIQSKRRAAQKSDGKNIVVKEESTS